jgi:ppGpp synthetase/RelA/SpoT-type nucleotidyltranferase
MNAPLSRDVARLHDGIPESFDLGAYWRLGSMAGWATPEFSRNQVDKAGFALIEPNSTHEEFLQALQVINNWRSAHSYPLLNFRINLARKLRSICPSAIIAQRIKRLVSIEAKLARQSTQLSQMQDIGGCRAIVDSVPQVRLLVDAYKKSKFAHTFKGDKDYITNPKENGYRGYHLIYQYKALPKQNAAYDKLRVEIQVRTRIQHAWATAVEAVGVFTNQALKANIGDQDWLRLFAIMSSQMAVAEKTAIVPGTPENESERIAEIKQLEIKLRAIQTLDAYRATIRWANEKLKTASYFLLEYDFNKNTIQISSYTKDMSKQANLAYTRHESAIKDGSKNIVLVSVDSVNALRRAYPNYFLDTKDFSEALKRCVSR